MQAVEARACKILAEFSRAQAEIIEKAVILTSGEAGTVDNVWLDELHGLRISLRGHDGKWPVSMIKFASSMASCMAEKIRARPQESDVFAVQADVLLERSPTQSAPISFVPDDRRAENISPDAAFSVGKALVEAKSVQGDMAAVHGLE